MDKFTSSRIPTGGQVRTRTTPRQGRPTGQGCAGRLLVALVMAGFAVFSYLSTAQTNEITGETQYIDITTEQEIALGIQAAPQMIQEYGGLDPNTEAQQLVSIVGEILVENSVASASPYEYEFYLLDDNQVVNAFALPGGQIFITEALFNQLETEGQLAGVLGHEIGHVIARHGAQRISQQKLSEGLTGAVVMATYDPENPSSAQVARIAQITSNLVTMKYGRDDELESDYLGVRIMVEAGYDPNALKGVMEILEAASGGARQPEFLSTHPSPANRIGEIDAAIEDFAPLSPDLIP